MGNKKHTIIIVAGGTGKRMQENLPKQFLEINKKPIIFHTIGQFIKYDSSIEFVISLHPNYVEYWKELLLKHSFSFPHKIALGGKERFHSVQNALELVNENCLVGIHDSVRPFVSQKTIKNCYKTASEKGSAIPVIDSINSLRILTENGNKIIDREKIKSVQTPQYFNSKLIKLAYRNNYSRKFTDDASVFEADGNQVFLTSGNEENIKITSPIDLIIGVEILKKLNS